MYPLLQQQAMPYHVMFRNTCCLTNQNQKQQQAMPYHVRFRNTCCLANQNQNQNQKQQRQDPPFRSRSARDITINFGKYKGKMLGSLPSSYLKWVSNNLRAGDFEEWAILADLVLVDPIYNDRIEWEFAQLVFEGRNRFRSREPADVQLKEISERFGWDYLDKVGWSKVNFNLLGTSYGGRIPRLDNPSEPNLPPATTSEADASEPNLPPATTRSRRMERRREKLKMRSTATHEAQQQPHKDDNVSAADIKQVANPVSAADIKQVANPFPGRQALLRKAFNYRAQS